MRKKQEFFLLFCFLICISLLSGCASVTTLSEDQNNIMAEYIAGLLLKYDKTNGEKLITEEKIEEQARAEEERARILEEARKAAKEKEKKEETAKNEKTPEKSTDSEKTPTTETTLNELLAYSGLNISYTGYKVREDYKMEDYLNLSAREGNEYWILEFKIENISNQDKKINTLERNFEYALQLDSSTNVKPDLTMLPNDLTSINSTIKAGKTKTAVILFQVSKKTKYSAATLYISEGTKKTSITIK